MKVTMWMNQVYHLRKKDKHCFEGIQFYLILMVSVSEWLLLTPNEQFLSHFMARESYIWWDDEDVHFILDQHTELEFYSETTVLWVDMLLRSDTFRFGANQSLFLLLNAVCLAEKQKIPIIIFGLTPRSNTRDEHAKPKHHRCSS